MNSESKPPPGAATASENRLLLDGTGLTPEAQERNHEGKTPTQQKKKFLHRYREESVAAREKSLDEEERAGLDCPQLALQPQ